MDSFDPDLFKYAKPEELSRLRSLLGDDDIYTYTKKAFPGFQWYRNCVVLGRRLEEVVRGELKRLMIFMPPRHGKSELVSRILPGYFLSKFPDKWVGLTSYGADLAEGLSETARAYMGMAGYAVNPKMASKRHWGTTGKGGCWAAGVGGPILGKGANLVVIDDPIKNEEEALSETERKKKQEWYISTLLSRLEPGAALVLMQQRFHDDDLAGYLLRREQENFENGEPTENWHIIEFAALAQEVPPKIPESCTLEPDWRQPGEALCPERFDRRTLLHKKANTSEYYWNAMYQQRPVPREGAMFRWDWFQTVRSAPEGGRRLRFWDRAASVRGDFTVGTLMSRVGDMYVVEDVARCRKTSGERDRFIQSVAIEDGPGVVQWGEQEPGAAGKDSAVQFKELMFEVDRVGRVEPATGSKEVRADPFAGAAELGKVKLVRAAWNRVWLEEICAFPFATHDDQVDTASGAFNKLKKKTVVLAPTPAMPQTNYWHME